MSTSGNAVTKVKGLSPPPFSKTRKYSEAEDDQVGVAIMSAGLQQQLASSLSEVGYGGKVGSLPPAVAQSERLGRFLQWLLHVLQPANCLSAAELER